MTSLVACAAGFCAWRALKHGGTWAGDRVLFEPVDSFDLGADPIIVIYSDAGKIQTAQGPLLGGAGLRMRVETWLPGAAPEGFSVGLTSALPFALFWRQCARALYGGAPGSWSDLFRIFAGATVSAETLFDLYETPKGERIAVRGQALEFGDGLAEPQFGAPPSGAWAQWIASMRAEGPEFATFAAVVEAAISGDGVADWVADLAALGVPASDASALRLTPADYPPLGEAGPLDIDVPVASAEPPAVAS